MSNIDKQALRLTAEKAQEHGVFNMDMHSQTVLALLDELEAKDTQIDNLTAERDALREGAMGDAKHSNTRAAADIYFQLVEECEIPARGSLVEHISELRERAEAAEKRIAALEGREVTLPPTFWYEHDDLSRDVPVMDARKVKKSIRDAGIRIAAAAGKGE